MKRALAERAKQSGRPNGVAPASPAPEKPMTSAPTHSSAPSSNSTPKVKASSSSTSLSQLPPKTMQIAKNESSSSAPSARPSSASPRPKKRLRESVVKLEDEDEDDSNASAFYLRHQNRALASELRSFKNELSRLSREREYRRSQCSKAVQSLNALQATWTQMEAALQYGQQPPPPAAGQNEANLASPSTSFAAAVAAAPLSTGSGTSVELIGALLDSLAALGTTMPGKRRRRIKQEGDEDEDMDGTSSSGENEEEDHAPSAEMLMDGADTQQLDDLLRITDNVAKRATTLQRWIWSLLQRLEGTDASLAAAEAGQLNQEQVARFKAKNKTLKAQLKELARSRDEMTASDKRVRRGLYRLAAGRVQLKEVLKAIVISDEDKEAAAAWLEVTPTPVVAIASSGTSATPASAVKSEGDEKEGLVNSAKVAQMKKQISDVEQLASARDEQIKKVRMFLRGFYFLPNAPSHPFGKFLFGSTCYTTTKNIYSY
jgi:E3 ubiquitin-protein ligase BRE1